MARGLALPFAAVALMALDASGQTALPRAPQVVVGVEGSSDVSFGRIADVAADGAGRVFVFDKYANRITVLRYDGGVSSALGRAGQGPGEFGDVSAMALSEAGRLYVADNGNSRVSVFDVSGEVVHYVSSFRTSAIVTDLCSIGDRLYLLTHTSPLIVTEVDQAGRVVNAFGAPEQPQGEMANEMGPGPHWRLSIGRLYCAPKQGIVIYASEMLPSVRAFSAEGDVLWRAAVPDFATVHLSVSRRLKRCCSYQPNRDTGTVSSIVGLAAVDGEYALVSVIENRPPDLNGTFHLYAFDIRTGNLLNAFPAESAVLWSAGDRFFGVRQDPVPSVVIYD